MHPLETTVAGDDWISRAACKDYPTALFFPAEHDDDETSGDNEIAKRICAGCPVQLECRESQFTDPYGVRGGLTAEERGYGRRGRLRPSEAGNLSLAVREVLAEFPDRAFTADDMNLALVERNGRGWPRNSLNAALLRAYNDGYADRHLNERRLLAYYLKGTT
jgi:WhiB family redox-sensing transcriptional regulator